MPDVQPTPNLLKRVTAPTLAEALQRVQREIGRDALLVETRPTRRGYLVVAGHPDAASPRPAAAATRPAPTWTRGFRPLAERGLSFGLDASILAIIENALIGSGVHLDRDGDPALPPLTARILKSLIPTEVLEPPEARVVAFVGPTGVGKTTTLAKLAAQAVRGERRERVAIISHDTFRVAAVEQLRAFADMLGAPFEIAFTPADLLRAVRRHAPNVDRIWIDTTGRSPFDADEIASLAASLGPCEPFVALCLAAATRRADAAAIADAHATLQPDGVVLTKWDETRVPGESLSIAIERSLPISHVTVGQIVPDDIVAADAAALAGAALGLDDATVEELA